MDRTTTIELSPNGTVRIEDRRPKCPVCDLRCKVYVAEEVEQQLAVCPRGHQTVMSTRPAGERGRGR